ncbi:FtsX-like permease family protein [Kutzneria kofuensis]|uniref:Putative ABC transport system permease protein n=1 Tax=Kutzneria kofuensis TaxID=103725 RepID=A0A7W9NIQ3_9PSEU|nr:FtsX family ABC transporter permease [Kutzneria kofuensis]MBB5894832.1 putative ABC transport system permease protein [Kutzneria kofuensis]
MNFVATHLRGVLRKPARLALTGVAIAVAAFFATAAMLTHDIAKETAYATITAIPSGVDEVAEPDGSEASAQLNKVRHEPGVVEATGRMVVPLTVGGKRIVLTADPGSGPLSRIRVASGTYPQSANQIAASTTSGLKIGSTVPVGGKSLTVTAIVDAPSADGPAAYMTDTNLLAVTPARLDRIDIRGSAPLWGAKSADDARAEAIAGVDSKVERLLAVLTAFVVVAVIAALLMATSTFRIVFAQRMRQTALLRAVGAPRRKLVWAFVAEGALVGFVAGLVGTAAAIGAGFLVARLLGVSGPGPALPFTSLVVLASILVALLAAVTPAQSATRISPLEALRVTDTERDSSTASRLRVVTGVLLLAAAGLVSYKAFGDGITATSRPGGAVLHFLLLTIASGTLTFCALLALGPVLLRPVLRGINAVLAPLGPTVRLAVQGVGGAPRRAAAVSAVVALGTGLLTGVLVGGETVRTFNDAQLAAAFPADVEVSGLTEDEPIPDAVLARLTGLKYRVAREDVVTNGSPTNLEVSDVDIKKLPLLGQIRTTVGALDDLGPGRAAVSAKYAEILKVKLGDTISLGDLHIRVAAIVVGDLIAGHGLVIDHTDLSRAGVPERPTNVLLTTDSPQSYGDSVKVDVLSRYRDQQRDLVASLEILALAVLALTLLIAIVGVGTTAALSVVERRRESGMLRAIGLTRLALGGITVSEAALHGVIGVLFGLIIGIPHAWLAVLSLGLGAPLTVPVPTLLGAGAGLVVLTMTAGLLPARRAARESPVTAMRVD